MAVMAVGKVTMETTGSILGKDSKPATKIAGPKMKEQVKVAYRMQAAQPIVGPSDKRWNHAKAKAEAKAEANGSTTAVKAVKARINFARACNKTIFSSRMASLHNAAAAAAAAAAAIKRVLRTYF